MMRVARAALLGGTSQNKRATCRRPLINQSIERFQGISEGGIITKGRPAELASF